MSNPTEEFQALWQAGGDVNASAPNLNERSIMQRGRSPQQESIRAQIFTIVILATLIVILLLFFYCLSPVQELLSIFGKWLTIGSILVRIIVEAVSLVLAKKIDFFTSTANFIQASRRLVSFREPGCLL